MPGGVFAKGRRRSNASGLNYISTCGNSISHRDLAAHGHDLVVRRASFARSCSCLRRQSSEQYLAFGACGMKILPQTAQFLSCTSHITVISSTSCTCGRGAPQCSCARGGSRRASATTSQTTSSLSLPRPLERPGTVTLQRTRPPLRLPDLHRRHPRRVGPSMHERPARGTRHQIGHRAPGGRAEQLDRRADQSSSPQNGQYLTPWA